MFPGVFDSVGIVYKWSITIELVGATKRHATSAIDSMLDVMRNVKSPDEGFSGAGHPRAGKDPTTCTIFVLLRGIKPTIEISLS